MELHSFTDILNQEENDIIENSQPMSINSTSPETQLEARNRPPKHTGQYGEFRSVEEIDNKYRGVFTYPLFNLVQSRVIEDVLYSDKSIVVCAPTGSGKTVVFEMAIVKLLMDLEDLGYKEDFKIIYMAPVKAICTERLTEWYPKFTPLGCLCIEVTGDTDVEFSQLKPYRIIITTPEKWHILTRRWTDHRSLVKVIKLFLIDEVHILNDETRGPVLEAVVSRMKTIEASCLTTHRIETLQRRINNNECLTGLDDNHRIRFVAVSATVSNPDDVATWLGNVDKPATYHKFGDECRPVKINRIVEGYPCPANTSIFKFDIILNYKLWNIIQRYNNGKPTLIFCNTRKSVVLTAETLSRQITIIFNPEQQRKLAALASTLKNKKLQCLAMSGVGYHHAGMLYEERQSMERAFRNRDLPILVTTTTLAMGVNLPAHLVIIKNTQQYVSGVYQEYSISTILQMVGRAGRPQFDTEATAVIMTRTQDKTKYQTLVGGSDPLQSYLHRRLAENLNSEVALRTVTDIAQCVEWLMSTFLYVRAGRDPRRYLSLPQNASPQQISKKIEDLCVKAINGLETNGLITMDEACCIESTEAGKLMSAYYLDFETMKHIMKEGQCTKTKCKPISILGAASDWKILIDTFEHHYRIPVELAIEGAESLERLLWVVCESHELSEMHLRVDERRCLNTLNRNKTGASIRYPMKGKITTRQMKLNCLIQSILGCLQIPDPSLNQEATKVMRIADRVCKCLVAYITRPDLVTKQSKYFSTILNGTILAKCIKAQLWENSPYVSRQMRGIGPAFSNLLVTAGKTSFLLLEESHPRDLERIMNKGPPAGNILRKQISLLPKYQIGLTPINHKTVSIQVTLLNQVLLSENLDNLTATENHRSYIIVGDTDNSLLLFTTFRDIDLINIYDGCIDYLVDRKNDFEYKIIVHCISSAFVGLDVNSEFTFQGLKPTTVNLDDSLQSNYTSKNISKQLLITNNFKQRKRKTDNNDIVESKEKRKRDCAIIREIKTLQESLNQSVIHETSNKITKNIEIENNLMQGNNWRDINFHEALTQRIPDISFGEDETIINDEFNNEDLPDNTKVEDIIKNGKNEILKNSYQHITHIECQNIEQVSADNVTNKIIKPSSIYDSYPVQSNSYRNNNNRKRTTRPNKPRNNNFKFLELLEKNIYYSDNEEKDTNTAPQNGFAESIKPTLNNFLGNTKESDVVNEYDSPYKIIEILSTEKNTESKHNNIQQNETNYVSEERNNRDSNEDSNLYFLNETELKRLGSSISQDEIKNVSNIKRLLEISNTATTATEKIIPQITKTHDSRNSPNFHHTFIQPPNPKLKADEDSSINIINETINKITLIDNNKLVNKAPFIMTNDKDNTLPPKLGLAHKEHVAKNKIIGKNPITSTVAKRSSNPTTYTNFENKQDSQIIAHKAGSWFSHLDYGTKNEDNETGFVESDIQNFTSKRIEIKNIDELSLTTLSACGSKGYDNKAVSKYKLELVNKVTLDVEVTDYLKKKQMYNETNTTNSPINIVPNILTNEHILVNELSATNSRPRLDRTEYDTNINTKINYNYPKPQCTTIQNKNIALPLSNYNNLTKHNGNVNYSPVANPTSKINATEHTININNLSNFNNAILELRTKNANNNTYLSENMNSMIVANFNSPKLQYTTEHENNEIALVIANSNNEINTKHSKNVANSNNDYIEEKQVKYNDKNISNTSKFTFLKQADSTVENTSQMIKPSENNLSLNLNSHGNVRPISNARLINDLNNQCLAVKKCEVDKVDEAEPKAKPCVSSVDSILSKYCNVLRKKNNSAKLTKTDPPSDAPIPLQNETNLTKNIPNEKLFKIEDINTINIDIPQKLIPEDIPSKTSVIEVESLIEDRQQENEQRVIDEIVNIPDLQIENGFVEHESDVDILSMLNPKTFLEHYNDKNKENNIRPYNQSDGIEHYNDYNQSDDITHYDNNQPSGIEDNDNNQSDSIEHYNENIQLDDSIFNICPYNQSENFNNNYNESIESISPNQSNSLIPPPLEFSDTNSNFNTNLHEFNFVGKDKNIFQDAIGPSVASVNMSISHEVETWTLSPEEPSYIEHNNNNMNPVNSFTIMRSNPISFSPFNNRKKKLSIFKFSNKEKLPYKKKFY